MFKWINSLWFGVFLIVFRAVFEVALVFGVVSLLIYGINVRDYHIMAQITVGLLIYNSLQDKKP